MSIERIKLEDSRNLTLIGTAHISKKSVEEVTRTIEEEKPNAVGIELDIERFAQIKDNKKWKETDLVSIIKSGKTYLLLFNILISNIQQRFGESLGVKPGSEMRAAAISAANSGSSLYMLDRNVKITLKRAISKMSIIEKLKLLTYIIMGFFAEEEKLTEKRVEELKKKDVLTELVDELSSKFPSIKEVLIDERDRYIAGRISQMQGEHVLAVVGAGHLDGIKKHLGKKINFKKLDEMPTKKSFFSFLKYLIPLLFVIVLIFLFQRGTEYALNALIIWVLLNGILSAFGVLIAGGKWQSIIAAFIAAPFTSLHPAIAAGWVAAAAEVKYSSPKVQDFEGLNKLSSLGDYKKNGVTRVLLVASLANLGSMLATFLFASYIVTLL